MSRVHKLKGWVRRVFPKATDDEVGHLLWNHTAFPFTTARKDILISLRRYKRALKFKKTICDFCNRLAVDGFVCSSCRAALEGTKKEIPVNPVTTADESLPL